MKNSFRKNVNYISNKLVNIKKKITRTVKICWNNNIVKVGGINPVIIQSMTNTDTSKINETVIQIKELITKDFRPKLNLFKSRKKSLDRRELLLSLKTRLRIEHRWLNRPKDKPHTLAQFHLM